jgi:hypothetical protein
MSADRYSAWNPKEDHFSLAIISVTVQLWTLVFWVISVYFNIRNTLPKSGTFLLGHLYMVIIVGHLHARLENDYHALHMIDYTPV